MYTEMLEKDWVKTDDKRSEYYSTMRQESERLSRLIENVLERLGSLVTYRSKKVRLGEVVVLQSKRLAACLENGKRYRPYIGRY